MNEEDGSLCFINQNEYNIPSDDQGNNIVTGEGSRQ